MCVCVSIHIYIYFVIFLVSLVSAISMQVIERLWNYRNGQSTLIWGQLFATAYKDSSVINVPPTFRCCKELALVT